MASGNDMHSPKKAGSGEFAGRVFHSSTSHLNLSRFVTETGQYSQRTPHKNAQVQAENWTKDECKGLPLVHFSGQTDPFLSLKLHETTQRFPQIVLTSCRTVKECQPLLSGRAGLGGPKKTKAKKKKDKDSDSD